MDSIFGHLETAKSHILQGQTSLGLSNSSGQITDPTLGPNSDLPHYNPGITPPLVLNVGPNTDIPHYSPGPFQDLSVDQDTIIERNARPTGVPSPIDNQLNPIDSLSDYNTDIFLTSPPSWLPSDVLERAQRDPELAAQLAFVNAASEIPLQDFMSIWADAGEYPQFDWRNDSCSSPISGVTSGFVEGCIRHDFLYRNFERIDAQFGLDGSLFEGVEQFENIADDRLGSDSSDLSSNIFDRARAQLTEEGVELPGSGANSTWTGNGWNNNGNVYGEIEKPDNAYTPQDWDGFVGSEYHLAPGPIGDTTEVPTEPI